MTDRTNHRTPHLSTSGKHSRREFLRRSALLAGAGVAAPWALDLAGISAASGAHATGGYRALVCLFMYGGNDHYDTMVPNDAASYATYAAARTGLARPQSSLLRLTPLDGFADARSIGFVPEWPGLKQLFDQRDLAVISNVGTLLAPTTKTDYQTRTNRPPQLFSHNDQQSLWQSSAPEGATTGWGGRLADLLLDDNGGDSVFTCISVTGNAVMMTGREAVQYQVDRRGVTKLKAGNFREDAVLAGLDEVLRMNPIGPFPTAYADITDRALSSSERLDSAITGVSDFATQFPETRLGEQLEMVARLISAGRNTLGVRRQVFFVATGGFDNHNALATKHPGLLAGIDGALSAFHSATAELGAADEVTTFTASDFGRTLVGNGDGSDHGWGSHHIVMGGAVRGRRVYGALPIIGDDGPHDVGRGRMLPTTSVEQYSSTLARWMGASGSELQSVVPNIGRFGTDDLGFFGPETVPEATIDVGASTSGLRTATRLGG
jgi:uncharacterized protein (DUF1501 family)